MGKKRIFNDEQEQYIMDNYIIMSNNQLAETLHVKREQINSWLTHRGIKRNGNNFNNKVIFSNEQVDFIKSNYLEYTNEEMSKILGLTKSQIQYEIKVLGLNNKRRKINDKYFHKIDTPLKAYILGFIYTDGYVCKNEMTGSYEFGMELQSCDKYILEKINMELGNKNIIYHKEPREHIINNKTIYIGHMDILRVYSKNIVNDLITHGIDTNKSSKSTFPIVNDDLFFDFLRGYIDGDGCYYTEENKYTYMHITCASIEPLRYIHEKLSEYNISSKLYSENNKKHRIMCINQNEMKN